jgi:hypothetical protein
MRLAHLTLAFCCDLIIFILKLTKPTSRKVIVILLLELIAFRTLSRCGVLAMLSNRTRKDMWTMQLDNEPADIEIENMEAYHRTDTHNSGADHALQTERVTLTREKTARPFTGVNEQETSQVKSQKYRRIPFAI